MSVYLKPGQLKIKDENGDYTGINTVALESTAEYLEEMETKGDQIIDDIEAKGEETIASIPDDYTELSNEVDELNERLYVDLANIESCIIDGEQDVSFSWESGTIDGTGHDAVSTKRIRTGFVSLRAVDYMTITPASGYKCAVELYNADGTFNRELAFATTSRRLTSETAASIRLLLATTNNDVVDTNIASNVTVKFKSALIADIDTLKSGIDNANPIYTGYANAVNEYYNTVSQTWSSSNVRLTTKTPILFDTPAVITIKSGYSYVVYKFANGESVAPSEATSWMTDPYYVNAGEWIAVVLAKGSNRSENITPAEIVNCYSYRVAESEMSTDIIAQNKHAYEALLQSKRPINSGSNGYLSVAQPVVLLHFSDIHADTTELQRIVDFRDNYDTLIDDTICTGDLVQYRYSDGISFWDSVDGTDDILIAIGNHDVLTAETGWDWTQRATQAVQYSTYISPYVSNWNVNNTEGNTYYYKDYTAKKVRLIVVNCMLEGDDNTAQLQWFVSTLASARTANLSVCVATHYMLSSPVKVDTNFTSLDRSLGSDFLGSDYMSAVNDFVTAGGEFICYIAGHTHSDIVVKSSVYTNQYCIVIDALNRAQANQYSDTQRTDDTKSQDLANLFVIDTASKVVKIIRVGADMDHYLRSKKQVTFKYLTGEIISEE